ncbi:MAG: phosphoenolpyruvate--protein phosphotransferase [Oscillospiraceae bacterium]|nr:phosphoenolpyruvate--protein phosphotransferase [Oscillospiraceae bacterium]
MIKYMGNPASGGLSVGKIKVINRRIAGFKRVVLATHREKALYEAALILAKDEIRRLMQRGDRAHQDILNFQLVMLDDNGLNNMIKGHIGQGTGAARAVEMAMEEYCNRLKSIGDEYLTERTSDIRDVLGRVVDILDGRSRERFNLTEPAVIVADEILPSDLAAIDRQYAMGFITVGGSYQSHANIIARTMGIPSVCGMDSEILNPLNNGRSVCLDGYSGEVYINPNDATVAIFNHRIRQEQRAKLSLIALKEKAIHTDCGDDIEIFANCNDPKDIELAIRNGARGIGLVRSEILFMKSSLPTLESQLDFYCRCIRAADGRPVTIRTFDIGADKPVGDVSLDKEPNPALGLRGIRLQYRHRDLFVQQAKALFIAADRMGPLNVMLPMVAIEKDVTDYLAMAEEVKQELLAEGAITQDNITWGVMIETPAATLISDVLAKHVKFFSIGTNDLTQYTLAADRLNTETALYYDPLHPSVLKLIEITVQNARKAGIKVSVCGESAADATCAKAYADIGVRCLSMAQNAMIPIKQQLLEKYQANN